MTNYVDNFVEYYPGYGQLQCHQNYLTKTIASVTNANPCVVTTSYPHYYLPGLVVRFLIPAIFGMQQLNNVTAQIIAVTTNTFTLNIDSTNFGIFAYPSPLPTAYSQPTVIPNSSGPSLPPLPLQFGNQDGLIGTVYNNGSFGDPVNGGV